MIRETLKFHADRLDGDRASIVRIGVDRASAARIIEKIRGESAEFQLSEIHVLFAALISTSVWIPSEEAFHERIGFFREHAFALAGGLVKAVDGAP
ncbi:hypothetical protein [Streptomyces avicenniae]|uniref:hypothetical protein n=1 Tax=Streptomyces avicenniae TaxID=500153 RepID=UPI00069B28BB|nr:hypothetical protein [Streptomyces avicenniae]